MRSVGLPSCPSLRLHRLEMAFSRFGIATMRLIREIQVRSAGLPIRPNIAQLRDWCLLLHSSCIFADENLLWLAPLPIAQVKGIWKWNNRDIAGH